MVAITSYIFQVTSLKIHTRTAVCMQTADFEMTNSANSDFIQFLSECFHLNLPV